MNEFSTPFIEAATYGSLYLAAVFLWAPKIDRIPLWIVAFSFSALLGLLGPTLNIVSVSVLGVLGLTLYCLGNQKFPVLIRFLSALALGILGVGLIVHRSFGFDNLVVVNKDQINYGEAALGILILGILHDRITTRKEWGRMLIETSWRAALIILVLFGSAFMLKYLKYDPKFPKSVLLFAATNLFFVCLAEEAFFRGFIQKYLCQVFGRIKFGNAFAILLAAAASGAAHFPEGSRQVIVAGVAALGFGWVYFRTQRIEASILAHFSVNMVYFLLFTAAPILVKGH